MSDRRSLELSLLLSKDSVDLSLVGWVSDEEWQVLLHLGLCEVIDTIELSPELLFKWLS